MLLSKLINPSYSSAVLMSRGIWSPSRLASLAFISTSSPCSYQQTPGSPANLRRRMPSLSDFPEIAKPNLFYTLRNWFLVRLLIQPYFDEDFTLKNFMEGACMAAVTISERLSAGDPDSLRDIVDATCLSEVKRNLSLFRPHQRKILSVNRRDFVWSFAYQVGIILGDEQEEITSGKMKRHVEITAVHMVVPTKMRKDMETMSLAEMIEDGRRNAAHPDRQPMILNYRFIRDFSKGAEPMWVVNGINHFFLDEKGEA